MNHANPVPWHGSGAIHSVACGLWPDFLHRNSMEVMDVALSSGATHFNQDKLKQDLGTFGMTIKEWHNVHEGSITLKHLLVCIECICSNNII